MFNRKPPVLRRPNTKRFGPRQRVPAATLERRIQQPVDDGNDFELDETRPPGKPWLLIGLLAGSIAAGLGLSIRYEFLLGQIAVPVIGLSALHGLWRGGFRKIIMMPVTLGMVFLVASYPDFADPLIRRVAGASSAIGNGIACVLAVVLTFMLVGTVAKRFRNRVILHRPVLRGMDRLFGTGIGLAEGAFSVLCMCWAIVLLEPRASMVHDHPNTPVGSPQHKFSAGLLRIAEEIDRTPLKPIVRDSNLIEKFPPLRDVVNKIGADGKLDLDSLDPELRKKALEYLRNTDPDENDAFGKMIRKHDQGKKGRQKAYDQLPPPKNRNR